MAGPKKWTGESEDTGDAKKSDTPADKATTSKQTAETKSK